MLYLDASAFVKRYIDEKGSEAIRQAMEGARWSACRICFVETVRAVDSVAGQPGVRKVREDWPSVDVVEVDQALSERAAQLTLSHRLRALDALHLAAALSLPTGDLTFATWDTHLHRAARDEGLETLPSAV